MIIESNFKEHEIEEIKELTKNDAVLSIRLIGEYSFLHERFLSRLNNNRHYVHKSIDLSSLEDFKKVQDELRKVEYPSKTITFEVSKEVTDAECINRHFIVRFMQSVLQLFAPLL